MGCINVTSCIFEGCNNPNEQQQQQQEEEEEEEVLAPSVGAFGRNAGHGDGAQGHARAASRVAATDFCEGGGRWKFGSGCCGTRPSRRREARALRWTMSEGC